MSSRPPLDLSKACILLANDDGIRSSGLKTLERIARELSSDVWVVAPEIEQSGAGHSLILHRPLRLRKLAKKRFALDGSPTDCIMFAIGEVMGEKRPDLVLTGVNRGMNVGEDVTYSGTVAAAMEATLLGIPAVALSLEVDPDYPAKWATAEQLAPRVVRELTSHAWPEDVFMNVNIPNLVAGSVKGVRVVNQGRLEAENDIIKLTDPRGRWYYWIGPSKRRKLRRNSDYNAIADGYIAVTPLHVDLTHRGMVRTLRKAFS